jgi:hypothetical protein
VHTGSLNNRRNQPELWQAIKSLCKENQSFSEDCVIRLIGKNDISIRESIEAEGLNSRTEWIDYLPHGDIIAEQKSAAVLFRLQTMRNEAEFAATNSDNFCELRKIFDFHFCNKMIRFDYF